MINDLGGFHATRSLADMEAAGRRAGITPRLAAEAAAAFLIYAGYDDRLIGESGRAVYSLAALFAENFLRIQIGSPLYKATLNCQTEDVDLQRLDRVLRESNVNDSDAAPAEVMGALGISGGFHLKHGPDGDGGGGGWSALRKIQLADVDSTSFPIGTGFSGVYNTKTGDYLLRPSSNDRTPAQKEAGWVPRKAGHPYVEDEFQQRYPQNNSRDNVGFAVVYESATTLVVTFYSGGINITRFGDPVAPRDIQEVVGAAIKRDAPHMTVTLMDRYSK